MSDRPSERRPLIVLGAGYTGRRIVQHARSVGRTVYATSRTPDERLSHIPQPARCEFDLLRRETWQHLPPRAHLLWCFPALPPALATAFLDTYDRDGGRLIILGSTAAYTDAHGGVIDERSPINHEQPRVASEEHLREHYGATIVRIAGIYGPGRHVLDWIRTGKVTWKTRYVNLVHVEDVAAITLELVERGAPGETYLVSDGVPKEWSEIFDTAKRRWGVDRPQAPPPPRQAGKRVDIAKLHTCIGYTFRYPDLYDALDIIERRRTPRDRP